MRNFTKEEKELIVNTPITIECFDMTDYKNLDDGKQTLMGNRINGDAFWFIFINYLEHLRIQFYETKDEQFFIELVRILPNSYNVVKYKGND